MLNLQRLKIFATVVENGSFTAAATVLGLTKAVVSFNIKQLEVDLQASLLVRNTRRLSLTDTGERFYPRCLRLLEEAESLRESVQQGNKGLSGILRITSTSEYGALVVAPALAEFSRRHPQLKIQSVSSSYHADLIAERFDIAIRLGQLADSSLRAALIDNFTILPVASSQWLAERPVKNLAQLAQVPWLAHSRLSTPLSWQVMTPEQQSVLFKVENEPVIMADSAAALLTFALQGSGVALLPDWLVRPALDRGELSVLLPDYHFPSQSIYALYPNTRHVPEKVRLFIDFLRARVASRD